MTTFTKMLLSYISGANQITSSYLSFCEFSYLSFSSMVNVALEHGEEDKDANTHHDRGS